MTCTHSSSLSPPVSGQQGGEGRHHTSSSMAHVAHHLEEKERTRDIEIDENVTFSDLLLSEAVLSGLHAAGFRRPSPIQLAAIPLGRCGLDLVVQAKSGTGKTCVLAVIALEAVSAASPATQVLVMTPTREVAVQVSQVVSTLAVAMPDLHTEAFIGGTKLAEDRAKLKECQVVVGTPGRLAQLVSLGHLQLERVRLLVLDEADRLLEGNFLGPVMDMAKALPLNKQVLCFSATYSDTAVTHAESLMRSPSHVRLSRESPALLGVNQLVRLLPKVASPPLQQAAKVTELLKVLSSVTFNQCLVFSGSQLRAESLCHRLTAEGWPAAHLTAAQCQTERLAALKALCSHRCRILVATDLASRGLDSPHVNLVVSVDLPPDPATYLHRAGRAGRYGSRGAAVTLVCSPEEWYGARAIATLANVRLLLVGQEWPGNLATHEVKGWRRVATEQKEKENTEERTDEGEGEMHPQKEPGDKDKEKARVINQEETTEERNIKKEEKKPKKDVKKIGKSVDEKGVLRLEEVEHLPEEDARTWLRAHKPYRKEGNQGKQGQENNVLGAENKSHLALRNKESLSNRVKSEGKKNEKKEEMMEKKVRKKKYSQQRTVNYIHGESDDDDAEEEDKDEEKENREGNEKQTKKHRHKTINATQKNQISNQWKQKEKEKQGQSKSTNTKKNKSGKASDTRNTQTDDPQNPGEENAANTANNTSEQNKTIALSLIRNLWQRPPPVSMSYSKLLSDCTPYFDNPTPPNTQLRVPPWPVQVEATEKEALALHNHLEEVMEDAKERRKSINGVRIDALTVLTAVMEGRDGRELVEDATQQVERIPSPQHTVPSTVAQDSSNFSSSSSSSTSSSSSSSSSDYPTSTDSKARKKHLSSTTSSTGSTETSSSSPQEHKDLKHKPPSREGKNIPSFPDSRQRYTSPYTPSSSLRNSGNSLKLAVPLRALIEHTHNATGARPKETARKQEKEKMKAGGEEEKSYQKHKSNEGERKDQSKSKKSEPVKDSHSSYGQWVPVNKEEEEEKNYQAHNQAYAGYSHRYTGQDQTYHTYNEGYQDYDQWYQDYYQDYNQDYEYYGQEYDEADENYDQNQRTQNYNQEFQDYNQYNHNYHQDYQHRYNQFTRAATHAYTPLTYTHGNTQAYIASACKFASMMEYVSSMGRVSMQVAQDYHSRRQQQQEQQQGRHRYAAQYV